MIKPYGGMLLVKENVTTDKTTSSGLVISAAFSENNFNTGTIVDIGDGEYNYKGDLIPVNGLDIGDTIYYTKHTGHEIEDEDGQKYLLLNAKHVLATKSQD